MENVNQSIIKISLITENSIAARDKGKSKKVEFEAKTDDDVLLDRPNLVGQLQMDHLERGTFLAWSPLVGLGPPSHIRNYKTTK